MSSRQSNLAAVVVVVKGVEDLTFLVRTVLTMMRGFFDVATVNDGVVVANDRMNHVTQTTGKEWLAAQMLHTQLVVGADAAAVVAVVNVVGVDGIA